MQARHGFCLLLVAIFATFSASSSPNDPSKPDLPYRKFPVKQSALGMHYLVKFSVGSDNTSELFSFDLIVDTGSGDVLVFSQDACNYQAQGNIVHHNCFNSSLSATFANVTEHFILSLLIDGTKAATTCRLGTDFVGFNQSELGPPPPPIKAPVFVGTANESVSWQKLAYWNNTDGTLGVAQTSASVVVQQLAEHLASVQQPVVMALSFNPQDPYIGLGGTYQDIVWAEAQAWRGPEAVFHEVTLFGLTLCGVDLFANYSSHWRGIIDTGATGFALPGEFFEMVLAWVPAIECVEEKDYSSPVCYLRAGTDPADLPTMSFTMSELKGEELYIPLADLVLPTDDGRQRLFLVRSGDIRDPSAISRVSFGTLSLKNLFTVLDFDRRLVGMRNQRLYPVSNHSCAARATCMGSQRPYAPMNTCLDPECHAYYLHEVTPDSKQCRMRVGFVAATIITLMLFAAMEIFLAEAHRSLTLNIMATFPTTG